jgi:prepilin-type N-terminal cleavage/methylation domain-containing protein
MKKRALTLVELITCLAIMAVIAGVVLTSFSLVDRRRLESAARVVSADLCWARQMAVSRHQDYIVTFNQTSAIIIDSWGNPLDPESYRITDTGGNPLDSARPTQRLRPVDMVSVTDFSGNPQTQIEFNFPSGIAQDRIVNLSHAGRTRPVRVYGETSFVRLD